MPMIPITIRAKKASAAPATEYVCGNSDYIAAFDFDGDWQSFPVRTARFQVADRYIDVIFEGTDCPIPVFADGMQLEIGVYSGNDPDTAEIRSTTAALVRMRRSIRSGAGEPTEEPPPDILDQVTALLNATAETTLGARDEAEAAAAEAREIAANVAIDADAVEQAKNTAVQAATDAAGAATTADEASGEAMRAAEQAELSRVSIEQTAGDVRDAAQQTAADAEATARDAQSTAEDAASAEASARAAQEAQNSMVFLKFGYGPEGDLRVYNMNLLAKHPEFRLNYQSGALEVAV